MFRTTATPGRPQPAVSVYTFGDGSISDEYLEVWSCGNVVCQTILMAPAGSALDGASFLSTIIETGSDDMQNLLARG
jgi:hypothetical protein